MLPLAVWALFCVFSIGSGAYQSYGTKKEGVYSGDTADVSAEADAVNHPGIDGTSKACRYDDGPGWSDCDPFELIRYKVLKLMHGGSQCEVMKNITKHCTPHDFPYGTHWLIQVRYELNILEKKLFMYLGTQKMHCRIE